MFRDLKEYQEIAKIYTDKVSKPEDLEERVRGGGMQSRIKPFEKPAPQVSGNRGNRPQMKGGIEIKKPMGGAQGRTKRPEPEKPMPTTAEIRAKNPKVVPGTRVNEIGAKGGGKPSSGDLSMFKDKKPEVSTMTKQGKPRTKAQMMAAKRIASGKSIQDVKDANTASMKAKAAERFAAFKAKRAEKKAAMEEYTPYDIVLEYLLSTEQVATIEEGNYVMTEMDAQTIQDIVEMDRMGGPAAVGAILGAGAVLAKPAIDAVKSITNFGKKMKKNTESQMNPKVEPVPSAKKK